MKALKGMFVSVCMTFKISTQHILAYVHSSPMQTRHNTSRVTGQKVTIFISRRRIVVNVNAIIGVVK